MRLTVLGCCGGIGGMRRPVQMLITHMEPGKEERTMAEVNSIFGIFRSQQLRHGQQSVY